MFQVITVPPDAPNLIEVIGSKEKFWFDDNKILFKLVRGETGEDWSEKIACELCRLLCIPHADYELGLWKEQRGVVTKKFSPQDGRLIHGNELLSKFVKGYPDYPRKKKFRVPQHTISGVLAIVRAMAELPIGFVPFGDVKTAQDVFIGYVMLDTWIANQDRHHGNWGVLLTKEGRVHLAPSFDHASCLGRNETDTVRQERLGTRDHNRSIDHYVERAESSFYDSEKDTRPLSTLNAFRLAARFRPRASVSWLERLGSLSQQQIDALFLEIPQDRISSIAIEFAKRMLVVNRSRLLNQRGALSQ